MAALAVVLLALAAGAWLALRPQSKDTLPAPVKPASRQVTDDAALETYLTPSQPAALPPVEEDATPLPVAPVSLDALFGKD